MRQDDGPSIRIGIRTGILSCALFVSMYRARDSLTYTVAHCTVVDKEPGDFSPHLSVRIRAQSSPVVESLDVLVGSSSSAKA